MITLTVNGKRARVDVDPRTPLLWVLRENLHLTGTKYGCGNFRIELPGLPVKNLKREGNVVLKIPQNQGCPAGTRPQN